MERDTGIDLAEDETPPLVERRLEDCPDVVEAFEAFRPGWEAWAAEHRRRRAVQDLYAELFRLYSQLLKQSEIVEVVLGVGLMDWQGTSGDRPIRTRRHAVVGQVELTFDSGGGGVIRVAAPGEGANLRVEDGSTIRDATHRGFSSAETPDASSHQPLPCVLWTVEVEKELIQISRWNGGSQVEQVENRQVIETGSRRVTEHMVDRLGIDYDDLRATAWCLQGDVMRPVSMAKQDRRLLIRRLLLGDGESSAAVGNRDAEPADTVRKARKQLRKARGNLDQAISDLAKAEEHESGARERLDGLQERWMAHLEQRSRHEVLLATIGGLEREREGLRKHLDDCVADLRGMRKIENRADRFDPSALDRAIGQLEEDLTELDRLETAFQDTREQRLIRNAAAKAQGDWYDAVSATLGSAIARGECSTCERRVWTGHSTLTKKLDNAKAEAKQARLRSARTNTPGTEETELSDDIRRLERAIDARQERVSILRYEDGYAEAAKSLLHRIPSQVAKQAELEGRLAETVRCIEQRKQELDANGYRDEEHQRLEAEVNKAEIDGREALVQVREKRKERDRLNREFCHMAQTAVDMSAEAVGVRTDEDDVRSRLETTMDEIVKRLAGSSQPPLAVSVDKDFKPTLHERNRDGPEVRAGGLDVMVALAMRLALVRLMREQRPERGSICDLLILDEPFGNVDSPRAKRFLELLLQDKEWQVLEIASASRVEHPETATVCTVCVEDGTAKVDGPMAST